MVFEENERLRGLADWTVRWLRLGKMSSEQLACCGRGTCHAFRSTVGSVTTEIRTLRELGLQTFILGNFAKRLSCTTLDAKVANLWDVNRISLRCNSVVLNWTESGRCDRLVTEYFTPVNKVSLKPERRTKLWQLKDMHRVDLKTSSKLTRLTRIMPEQHLIRHNYIRRLCIQYKKLHKDNLFFGWGQKENWN